MNAKETLERKLEEAFQLMHITGKSESPVFKLTKGEIKELRASSKKTFNLGQFKWLLRGYNAPFKTIKEI